MLVLSTAAVSRVVDIVGRVRSRWPEAQVVVAATAKNASRLVRAGVEAWVVGESALPLDSPSVREEIRERGFDTIVVPVGAPTQALFHVARFVASLDERRVAVETAGWLRLDGGRRVRLFLILHTLVVFAPWHLLLLLLRSVDALLLLLFQVAARCARRLGRRFVPGSGAGVFHVISHLTTGGGQRLLLEYLRGTDRREPPIHTVVLFEYDPEWVDELARYSPSVELFDDVLQASLVGRIGRVVTPHTAALLLLYRRLRQHRPRCLYGWLFLANVVGASAARLAGVPRVVSSVLNLSVRKTLPQLRQWWLRPVDRLSAPLNDMVVGNSRAVAADYAAWSGVDPEHTVAIYNGIDVEAWLAAPHSDVREDLGAPDDQPLLLYVGRLAYQKNLPMVVRACALLRARGVPFHMVFVGPGDMETALRHEVARLELEDRVHLVGRSSEPQSYYRAAAAFVLASFTEGMPCVAVEAQLFGVPVVTTSWDGADEVVVDGKTGFVVAVDDDAAMADRLELLISDPPLRAEMGRQASAWARQEFSVAKMAAAIDELTGRREPGPRSP